MVADCGLQKTQIPDETQEDDTNRQAFLMINFFRMIKNILILNISYFHLSVSQEAPEVVKVWPVLFFVIAESFSSDTQLEVSLQYTETKICTSKTFWEVLMLGLADNHRETASCLEENWTNHQ